MLGCWFFGGEMTRNKAETDVLNDLYFCFVNHTPVPKRVSDAFIEKYKMELDGEIKSWNEVFGRPRPYRSREKFERRLKQQQLVVDEVEKLRADGGPLNEQEYEAIGIRTGVGGKSKVKELLSDAKLWAKRTRALFGLD